MSNDTINPQVLVSPSPLNPEASSSSDGVPVRIHSTWEKLGEDGTVKADFNTTHKFSWFRHDDSRPNIVEPGTFIVPTTRRSVFFGLGMSAKKAKQIIIMAAGTNGGDYTETACHRRVFDFTTGTPGTAEYHCKTMLEAIKNGKTKRGGEGRSVLKKAINDLGSDKIAHSLVTNSGL